jgi:hypothetical protein
MKNTVQKRAKMLLPRKGRWQRRRKVVRVTVMKSGPKHGKATLVVVAAAAAAAAAVALVEVAEQAKRYLGQADDQGTVTYQSGVCLGTLICYIYTQSTLY